jgi:hypothetical protein
MRPLYCKITEKQEIFAIQPHPEVVVFGNLFQVFRADPQHHAVSKTVFATPAWRAL